MITHEEQIRAAKEKLQADLDEFAVISEMGRFELRAAVESLICMTEERRRERERVDQQHRWRNAKTKAGKSQGAF